MRLVKLGLVALFFLAGSAPCSAQQKTREQKVRDDKQKVESEGFWIYNDLAKGFAEAKSSGKPLLVVLRCIPCEECVKLDDDLVDQDPVVRPLLDKFVCVRQVSTNGLDLSLFQYDTDQSFAVFMLNADGTIYGRFGTRSHRTEWLGDVSLKGLGKALQGALSLHANYPNNKAALSGKRGGTPEFATPEQYPSLREKYTDSLNYEGNVVQSCIHCHQIGDAQRAYYRAEKQPIPEEVLFPYPHPKSIGLILDPNERATVTEVSVGTAAEKAGFTPGDNIISMAGQPILSLADIQWVLHQTPGSGGKIPVELVRDGKRVSAELGLPAAWRRASDITWRVSSWGLRRMTTGGMVLIDPSKELLDSAKLDGNHMALEVKSVGKFGPHAAAKNAGFQPGDLIVSFDGRTDLSSETDLFLYAMTKRQKGDSVPVEIIRGGKRKTLKLPMQE